MSEYPEVEILTDVEGADRRYGGSPPPPPPHRSPSSGRARDPGQQKDWSTRIVLAADRVSRRYASLRRKSNQFCPLGAAVRPRMPVSGRCQRRHNGGHGGAPLPWPGRNDTGGTVEGDPQSQARAMEVVQRFAAAARRSATEPATQAADIRRRLLALLTGEIGTPPVAVLGDAPPEIALPAAGVLAALQYDAKCLGILARFAPAAHEGDPLHRHARRAADHSGRPCWRTASGQWPWPRRCSTSGSASAWGRFFARFTAPAARNRCGSHSRREGRGSAARRGYLVARRRGGLLDR